MQFLSSRRLLALALGGAALLSAVPQSSQASWSSGLATVLLFPLGPGTRALAWVRDSIRPPTESYPGLPEDLRAAHEDRDRLQGELNAAELRVSQLERELGELTGFRPALRAGWRPRLATIIERAAGRPPGLLGIDIGSEQGVQPADPAVVSGNQLVGQVASGGTASRSWLIPLDDRRSGRIDALVYPAHAPEETPAAGAAGKGKKSALQGSVLVQLVPQGDRRLAGELELPPEGSKAAQPAVNPGDPVVLSDATWRPAAQGMRVGVVESVGVLDANPMRRKITVRMESDPARLGRVVIKVQENQPSGGKP